MDYVGVKQQLMVDYYCVGGGFFECGKQILIGMYFWLLCWLYWEEWLGIVWCWFGCVQGVGYR